MTQKSNKSLIGLGIDLRLDICSSPISIDQRVKNSEVSFNRYGDSHENAAGEEDVVEGVEKDGKEMVMQLSHFSSKSQGIALMILESSPDTFKDAYNQEEEIENSKCNEQIVEVALQALFAEDSYGKNVGTDSNNR